MLLCCRDQGPHDRAAAVVRPGADPTGAAGGGESCHTVRREGYTVRQGENYTRCCVPSIYVSTTWRCNVIFFSDPLVDCNTGLSINDPQKPNQLTFRKKSTGQDTLM